MTWKMDRKTWVESPSVDECDGCGTTAAKRLDEGFRLTIFSRIGAEWFCTPCYHERAGDDV